MTRHYTPNKSHQAIRRALQRDFQPRQKDPDAIAAPMDSDAPEQRAERRRGRRYYGRLGRVAPRVRTDDPAGQG